MAHDVHGMASSGGRNRCPPHGPHLIETVEDGLYCVVRCLKCGVVGPVREGASEAKLAFDQRWR